MVNIINQLKPLSLSVKTLLGVALKLACHGSIEDCQLKYLKILKSEFVRTSWAHIDEDIAPEKVE